MISKSTASTLIAVIGVTVCLVVLIKWYFSGGVCKSKARLDGKIYNIVHTRSSQNNFYRISISKI